MKKGNILIVDDDEDVLVAARLLLKKLADKVVTEKNPELLAGHLEQDHYDVVLLDMNFKSRVNTGNEGFFWLRKVQEISPDSVVIMITAFGDVEQAVRSLKEGATDFVLKPWQNEKLLATVSAALKLSNTRSEVTDLKSKNLALSADMERHYQEFIGYSNAMQQVFSTIDKVANTDANILILGENGTGKELVARALHRKSMRSGKVFISVDMGAITETLFESELFGHMKGAFTDAREEKAGRFEVASGGTLFLDEIGNLSLPLQAKLLAVLQNRQITRVGANKPIPIDIRLICATNMPLQEMVMKREFRQDLLYRINTVEIQLPPLRERQEDVPLLAEYFAKIYCKKYHKPQKGLQNRTLKKLQQYSWPGNVRELQHAIERAVIMSDHDELEPSDFFFNYIGPDIDDHQQVTNLTEMERLLITRVIQKHGGNITHAAQELGLTRASLYRRMSKYGL